MPRPRPTLCAPRLQTVETVVGELDGVKLLTHALPTAGVVYADVLLDLTKVPLDQLPLARFFSNLIDEIGTSELSAVAM